MIRIPGSAKAVLWIAALLPALQAQVLLTGSNTLSFTATAGGASPAPQTVAISHTGDTPKTFTVGVNTATGGNWLGASASTGMGVQHRGRRLWFRVDRKQ